MNKRIQIAFTMNATCLFAGQEASVSARQIREFLSAGPRHIMKKTDTCYYMSITKEENSAFVVANNQSGIAGEGTQVIVETKADATSASNESTTSTTTTNTTMAIMNSGATSATTTTTTTTTISTSCLVGGGGDGNGTAISNGADAHQRFSNSYNVALSETLRRQETCTGPRAQDRPQNGPQGHRAPLPPQVILQVLPSTPTPIQHHNLLASDVHRECRMRLAAFCSFLFFSFSSSYILLLSLLVCRFSTVLLVCEVALFGNYEKKKKYII